ncbi:MAG: type I-E CRISPR-associated protein Cse1/CasA [Magnetococcales bacterium]|nr:type I-E CRISPR-associated protein Cse1/CasA [Magnetococcales bacterium]
MNLIEDRWIPVRRADGSTTRIRPAEIVGGASPVVALHAPRPDFNGALAQFLIGLLQTVAAPEDEYDWNDRLEQPPTQEELTSLFASVAFAFNLDGDGPRFMQDLEPDMGGEPAKVPIASLLIDSPTEAAIGKGTDLFQKRETIQGVCRECTATALFTLHTNAPSGGSGHRTSLRGGGPLTTLVVPQDQSATLWSVLWWNVLEQPEFLGNASVGVVTDWFPWLSKTRTSKNDEVVTAADGHPALVYWAMPRRIRMDFQATREGRCDLCGRAVSQLLERYLTRPHGMNCTDWMHPLSPYYADKQGVWLPTHPQDGGIGYRHWPDLVVGRQGTSRPARVVEKGVNRQRGAQRIWSFGYDMDNMKARCWYEAYLPWIELPDPAHRPLLSGLAANLVDAAMEAKDALLFALRKAWFSPHNKTRGDMEFLSMAYWARTEADFYNLLWQFAEAMSARQQESLEAARIDILQAWHGVLCRQSFGLFDQWAASGMMEYENPARLARAHHQLAGRLYGVKLRETILGLPPKEKTQSTKKRRSR